MDQLKVGNEVLAADGVSYTKVYSFGHLDRNREAEFLQIHTSSSNPPIEVTADQQQWRFQNAKRERPREHAIGFVTTGLWRFSRHPNYAAEQAYVRRAAMVAVPCGVRSRRVALLALVVRSVSIAA